MHKQMQMVKQMQHKQMHEIEDVFVKQA